MVSRERGLILPNESHAYGNPFMISVQDGLKNTEAHDDTVRRNTHTHTHTHTVHSCVHMYMCVLIIKSYHSNSLHSIIHSIVTHKHVDRQRLFLETSIL